MRPLSLEGAGEAFEDCFLRARKERFKAELLGYYAMDEGPSLDAWRLGDLDRSKELARQDPDYQRFIAQSIMGPVTRRVHVIDDTKPLTEYMQWEIEVIYKSLLLQPVDDPESGRPSGSAIEEVQLAPISRLPSVKLPSGDFWVFDNSGVVEFTYSDTGETTGASLWEPGDDISYFLGIQRQLLAVAEPIRL